MTEQRHPRETVEADIPFDQILDLLRCSDRDDAAGLLHSMLQVAFNNGEAAGSEEMARIAQNVLRPLDLPAADKNGDHGNG